jgi:tRNA A37 threonylcarbamoyladenosine modification protein TsaB
LKFPALLLDSSTRHLVFGRIDSAEKMHLVSRANSDNSEDTIDDAVAQLFPNVAEIGEIWLGQGPGSFVGLRSSFAYARMLAMLTQIDCRVFFSSLLWREILNIESADWLLIQTNAKLFYADRFVPQREALAIDTEKAAGLVGARKYCFADSWSGAQNKIPRLLPDGCIGCEPDAKSIAEKKINLVTLALSDTVDHVQLAPLYGHELNFVLAPVSGAAAEK